MDFDDVYTYTLTVEGGLPARLKVYELLSELPDIIGQDQDNYLYPDETVAENRYSKYNTAYKLGVYAWDETEMEETLHSVAMQYPSATITITGQNCDDKSYGFTKRFRGEFYQEKKLVSYTPPLIEGGDIPFDKRHDEPDLPYERRVYLLCEEHEGSDGLRSFTILAMGEDKEALQKLLEAKVDKDEYGYIAEYGESESSPNRFESNYGDGYVEYYIIDEPIQTPEQLKALLSTKEYDNSFAYPENLKDILIKATEEFAEKKGYGKVNSEVVVETLFYDPEFRSMVMKAFWGDQNIINDYCMDAAFSSCYNHLKDKVYDSPDFFEEIGAVPSFTPPSNLKDIVIDSIYDVSKVLHLPVYLADELADIYMRNSDFRDAINTHCHGITTLEPNTFEYKAAVSICYDHVEMNLRKEYQDLQDKKEIKGSLDGIIKQATSRSRISPSNNLAQKQEQGR